MKRFAYTLFASLLACLAIEAQAQVPQSINYQGRIQVGLENFEGVGQFKFALVNGGGAPPQTYWSNDGSSVSGQQPIDAVAIPVAKGLYSVLLGDPNKQHMTLLPSSVFDSGDVHLRIWFSDGVNGFQLLFPDQRIAAVGYAIMAANVANAAVTTSKLADAAVTGRKLADDAVATDHLRNTSVTTAKIENGAITADKLATGSVETSKLADAAVTQTKIAPSSVLWSHIANGVLDNDKINSRFSLWNRSDTSLSYSGGNVGIGTAVPEAPLEVSSGNSFGTWIGLRNTSGGGKLWRVGSLGSDFAPGTLQFDLAGEGSKMILHPEGNLWVKGDVDASNIRALQDQIPALEQSIDQKIAATKPRIQFAQDYGSEVHYGIGDNKVIDTISVVVPAAGFLYISVNAHCNIAPDPFGEAAFRVHLNDLTTGERQMLASDHGGSTGGPPFDSFNISFSWVLQVDSAKTVRLETRGSIFQGVGASVQTHGLFAIYIPTRAE